mgnify:CR=1 FL=1
MAKKNKLAGMDLTELVEELRETKHEALNRDPEGGAPDRTHQPPHPPTRDRCGRGRELSELP